MEQSDIPVFIGTGNDNQPVTTKITSINFVRLLNSIKIVPTKETPIHIFGLLSRQGALEAYECEGSMTSAAIIAFIDDFLASRTQRTAIVLDNAPIHKSYEFQEAMNRWKEKDLFIFFLPT